MKPWRTRPREESYLLNPGFCALVLWSSAGGYRSASQEGMPIELAFMATPLVLHKPTREALPGNTRTSMAAWIEKNAFFRVGFAERAQSIVPFTREALLFGSLHGIVALERAGRIIPGPRPHALAGYLRETTQEVRHCTRRAEFVGKWFAGAGSIETIMALWGVRP